MAYLNTLMSRWEIGSHIPIFLKSIWHNFYAVIFIKGSRGLSYLTIEVRWTPQFLKFEFIPHLDTFLFEMQNVTAACSTILFNNLIPIKNSYFNDHHSLSDISKRKRASRGHACPSSFFNLIDLTSKISVSNAFWIFDSYFIKIIISFHQDV